jgi:hypothetical protein
LDGLLGELTAAQHEHLKHALNNICQLKDMVSDLLDITRIDEHKIVLQYRCENATKLITDVLSTCSTGAAVRNITLHSDIAQYLPFIWADAVRVRQILINLLDNAIKFTPHGGTVTVEGRGSATQDGFLYLSVSDTGCGISLENLDIVFDRLAQVEGPADLSRTGLGLGLFIAKELVSLHGGRIWAESQLGHGSSFCFTLPVFSARRMCAHIFTEPNLSGGFVSLIAVDISALAGTVQKGLAPEIRRVLSTCIHPSLDVLWPAVNETEPVRLFFIVAFTDASGCAIIGNRIERELRNFENIAKLEPVISSTTLLVPGGLSREDQTDQLLRQIDHLLHTQLQNKEAMLA